MLSGSRSISSESKLVVRSVSAISVVPSFSNLSTGYRSFNHAQGGIIKCFDWIFVQSASSHPYLHRSSLGDQTWPSQMGSLRFG
jgi:hypothetical protein